MNKSIAIEELEAILNLCRLNDKVLDVRYSLTPSIQQLATYNGVAAWIYSRYKNGLIKGIDDDQLMPWKNVYFQNTIQYQKFLAVFKKVSDLLQKHGIQLLALKGMALASELYADEGLRPMGDLDILVPEGRGAEALQALLDNGAQQLAVPRSGLHEQADAHVRAIRMDGIMVEVHQRLFARGSAFYLENTDRFTNSIGICKQGIEIQRMNDILMAYHLVAHALKGIHMGGLRLGWLLDIAILLGKVDNKATFIDSVLSIKPSKKKALKQVLNMALLLLPDNQQVDVSLRRQELQKIAYLMEEKDLGPKHRLINLFHLFNTPGFGIKAQLLWREFFPEKEYMEYRYQTQKKEALWRLYIKRIIRR